MEAPLDPKGPIRLPVEGEPKLERVVEELQAGVATDENFRRLFVHFWPPLDRFFARCGIPAEERGDLTQETFLRIYDSIVAFRREARFETWVFTIATNVYRTHLRNRLAGKRSAREVSLAEPEPESGSVLAELIADDSMELKGPEDRLLRSERIRGLLDAMEDLPGRMRKCLILRSFQSLTYEEIAAVMRLSTETVRSHLFQARRRLKELLSGSASSSRYRRSDRARG